MSTEERDPMDVSHEWKEQEICDAATNRDAEIRIAMCELCGFTVTRIERDDHDVVKRIWVDYPDTWRGIDVRPWAPDFLKDLNAARHAGEILRRMSGPEWWDFGKHLHDICGSSLNCIQATARQRCEAILRTLGKWKTEWNDL